VTIPHASHVVCKPIVGRQLTVTDEVHLPHKQVARRHSFERRQRAMLTLLVWRVREVLEPLGCGPSPQPEN
jgi:hypothetical protein